MTPEVEQSRHAAELLENVRVVRGRTRRRLQSYWFPLLVFGTCLIGSAPFFALLDGAAVGLYWLAVGPLGTVIVARHYRRQSADLGVMRGDRVYSVLGACLFVLCFGLGFAGGIADNDAIAEVGPPLAISCGYLALAWIERSLLLAILAVGLGAFSLALLAGDVASPGPLLAIVYGVSFIVVGVIARGRVQAR